MNLSVRAAMFKLCGYDKTIKRYEEKIKELEGEVQELKYEVDFLASINEQYEDWTEIELQRVESYRDKHGE